MLCHFFAFAADCKLVDRHSGVYRLFAGRDGDWALARRDARPHTSVGHFLLDHSTLEYREGVYIDLQFLSALPHVLNLMWYLPR